MRTKSGIEGTCRDGQRKTVHRYLCPVDWTPREVVVQGRDGKDRTFRVAASRIGESVTVCGEDCGGKTRLGDDAYDAPPPGYRRCPGCR